MFCSFSNRRAVIPLQPGVLQPPIPAVVAPDGFLTLHKTLCVHDSTNKPKKMNLLYPRKLCLWEGIPFSRCPSERKRVLFS